LRNLVESLEFIAHAISRKLTVRGQRLIMPFRSNVVVTDTEMEIRPSSPDLYC